jgi:integrase
MQAQSLTPALRISVRCAPIGHGWKKAGILEGPVFRAVTRHGKMGDVALSSTFSGHSLRAGHATSAAQNDAPGHAIQRQLRHKSFNTTGGYIREGRLFKGSSATFALR